MPHDWHRLAHRGFRGIARQDRRRRIARHVRAALGALGFIAAWILVSSLFAALGGDKGPRP